MKILFTTLKKTLFWSYERGSWQYDVMCVLILVFVFFAPNSLFHSQPSSAADAELKRPRVVTSDEIGVVERNQINEVISRYLSNKDGHEVEISRIETVTDNQSGKIKYLAYEK